MITCCLTRFGPISHLHKVFLQISCAIFANIKFFLLPFSRKRIDDTFDFYIAVADDNEWLCRQKTDSLF